MDHALGVCRIQRVGNLDAEGQHRLALHRLPGNAYENTSDYVDHLVIVVESQSDRLLVTQTSDCAIHYRANRKMERSGCKVGENNGAVRSGLPLYGGALIAEFNDLKPGDEAIIKYKLTWH